MMKLALKAPSRPESFSNRKSVTFPSLGAFQDKDEKPEMRSAEGFTLPREEKISAFQTILYSLFLVITLKEAICGFHSRHDFEYNTYQLFRTFCYKHNFKLL